MTLEEGLKVYQYLRETADSTSYGMCVYDCCFNYHDVTNYDYCHEIEENESLYDGCEAKIEKPPFSEPPVIKTPITNLMSFGHYDCTLKATAVCKEDGDCITNPSSIENGEEEVKFFQG